MEIPTSPSVPGWYSCLHHLKEGPTTQHWLNGLTGTPCWYFKLIGIPRWNYWTLCCYVGILGYHNDELNHWASPNAQHWNRRLIDDLEVNY